MVGAGWEGEVYRVVEVGTGIERAAKLFFPHRNIGHRTSRSYAKKLYKLRHCSMLIHYQTEEVFTFRGIDVVALISEYVEGEMLSDFVKQLPRRRLHPFEALHFLYALSLGMEEVHRANEYHGDLHSDNIIVSRYGLRFDLKLLDLFHLGGSKVNNRRVDVCDVIRMFYDVLGGAPAYAKHPEAVKYICSGLKTSLILDKFPTMSRLRRHLEEMAWQ
ncbi:MAG: protein kinase [Candidatus Eisenbacteria bacterium]|uniref:Protein kinase n=1 Tax=Eiseniibacteriota bacterium TaxID=2212470 RepID=A0A948W3H1_UNCEI|nr:protein kinase [Candidatus Eisenbacteria bacterium]MBU1949996.1 protein kinase [Candidatus Eisenbacteria bacterium]MBU2691087.1 protein kinase [Candidatus Eisenbacteria bacterium]